MDTPKSLRSNRSQMNSNVVSARARYSALVLEQATRPRNQKRTKKKVIASGGPKISGISYPISIKECMENKRRLSRVEKAMEESVLQVSKNVQNSNIVSQSWSRQILAHLVNSIGNVWMNISEIN